MNHGSLCLKNTSNQTNTRDLSDISIASVGLARYHEHGMLTDDDDDEIIDTSDEYEDDDDDEPLNSNSTNQLLSNNHDSMDLNIIDRDTQTKLAALLQATGITNSPIPDEFWRDKQVVQLLTSSVTNNLNLNGLHEIAHAMSSTTNQQETKTKFISKDYSELFLRACLNNDLQTIEKFLKTTNGKEHISDVNEDGDSVLTLACSNGYLDLVRLLLTTIPNIDIDDRGTKQDCTPLMEACTGGHYEIVELLLKSNASVNMQSTSGNTALHYAAGGGYADIVRLLLEHGAKVEETNENGHTPLMEAASGGHVEVAQVLLNHGAGVNTQSIDSKHHKTDEMHTALMEACMDGHVQVARLLLDHGADVNMPPDSYESPLTLSACGGHIELVKLLIERGANLEEVNDEGYTPLMEASREGHDELVSLLVSKGADVNHTTEDQQETALTLACAGGYLDVAKILIQHEANVNLGQSTPLMEAAQEGHLELVQYLIENHADVNRTASAGETALSYACEGDHTEVAEVLLHSGAHIDQTDNEGRTALMKAVRAGHLCTVRYLISKGADINRTTNSNDANVLSLACANGHFDIASLLLQHGADPNHLLKDRLNCLIEAVKGGYTEIVKLLLEYPKNVTQTVPICETTDKKSQPLQSNLILPQIQSIEKDSSNTFSGKKKRTTSSSSTSSSSSSTSSSSSVSESTSQSFLPNPPQTIDFFSTCSTQSNSSSLSNKLNISSLQYHQHYSKLKRSFHRTTLKSNRRIEQIETQMKNFKFLPTTTVNDDCQTNATKISMCINTDTQKALEHLRELVNHPSNLELKTNHPDLVQKIKKVANQSFSEQLKSLPPFTSSINKLTHHEPTSTVTCLKTKTINEDQQSSRSSLVNNLSQMNTHRRFQNRIDIDCETDSNHDTALTLACAGGHEELVCLLLHRGANIEHRDKKGFTPLILAATAGHANIVGRLLENDAMIEAQSERTKDTALSLACSGGRQDVVEVLLKKGANREHRNVSDYTALSLAASGGYVNIIRLLLNYGAEVNSRTGSKLGITPLMLASMNGHVAAVKLLLDMNSDINAQIETNRNTALTLACFQGRAEVVSLLVDRKANIEHRAKTGLTPLMESASGGYVDVGRVLLERGADVNAPPVPTSKDTALTIAADKGHHKFVELLLLYDATIDARNKKGATPLWLACNNGHLEVVQLLITRGADPDTSDLRKVSCLMAAFRKGHSKVVKYLVRQVRQFPSDADCRRLITTITDKDLLKKCQICMDLIISAKERQAAEANKAANSLLKEIDLEKSREETRKVAAAKKREKRKAKKKGKQKSTTVNESRTKTEEDEEDDDEEEHNENEEPVSSQQLPSSSSQSTTLVVDDDLRLQMVNTDNKPIEPKSPSPESSILQSKQSNNNNNNNKKKTNTMTRKIERRQENLALKTKQQETNTIVVVDDDWQEVIGKQKKIVIPHEQYSRIIGRNGSNLNVLREATGATIEIENKRAIGDKTIVIKGTVDAIKHAHQLVQTMLKNSQTDLMSLLPSINETKSKSRSNTVTSNHDDENTPKIDYFQVDLPTTNNTRSSNIQSKRNTTTTNSSSIGKTSQPLTVTGATWVNSNRWNHQSNHIKPPNSYHYSHSNKHYPNNSHQKIEQSTSIDTNNHPKPLIPSQPGYRMPLVPSSTSSSSASISPPPPPSSSTSLLVAASTTGGYNPFASNILTTSLADVLTKPPKESTDESNSSSTTKMNFANVTKMNVAATKSPHHEPITITMNETLASMPDPKAAPGYRGPSSASSRAPGANRHPQSVSPSMNKILIEQNGQTGSSTTSSTSSSPSSTKQQQQKPLGPIGSHRMQISSTTDVGYTENPIQMRTNFNRTLSANNPPLYQQPSPMMLNNNPTYANLSRSRSNLNPSAPEFQHCNQLPPSPTPVYMPTAPSTPMSNGTLSANIMNIARMMEQKQQQQQQQQFLPTIPLQPPSPQVVPQIRPVQQFEMDGMQQHVQNQTLHYWRMQTNQQQFIPHPPPPPPPSAQPPTTLEIAHILASKGQLPQDPNQAAALVATYYAHFLSRTQMPPTNIPLSSNVNKNVYETINTQSQTSSNSDEIPLNSVESINGHVPSQIIIEPNAITSNSNHSTGPPSSSVSSTNTTTQNDQKMIPAAIGSERKRYVPMATPMNNPNDWSSVTQQPYLQQQSMHDYTR